MNETIVLAERYPIIVCGGPNENQVIAVFVGLDIIIGAERIYSEVGMN